MLIFDLRRDAPWFFHWLVSFATHVVVPKALRIIDEPQTSLISSFTVHELKVLMEKTDLISWQVQKGFAWSYLTATKTKEYKK